MSETYLNCEITEESSDRAVILFSLVMARRFVNLSSWETTIRLSVIARIDELIEEYRNPHSGPDSNRGGEDGGDESDEVEATHVD